MRRWAVRLGRRGGVNLHRGHRCTVRNAGATEAAVAAEIAADAGRTVAGDGRWWQIASEWCLTFGGGAAANGGAHAEQQHDGELLRIENGSG